MAQNIYDDPAFFEGYSGLARSVHGLDGAPEWPSLRALLPEMRGLRVVDLGCGFGWFCRFARQQGAAHVLGLDVSEKMLARAKAETADPGVEYVRADLDALELAEASFDLAYSSLALHYVADFRTLAGAVHRALVPGGRFVFSIEQPINMASMRLGWIVDAEGNRTWPVDHYQMEGRRETNWFTEGVVKYHRKLSTTLNLLIEAGFRIVHVDEWGPTEVQVAAQPELAEERHRPMFVLIAAER
ncbi:MAG: class I SAM-dependent methyltransferase [Pararhizobium sp.]